jgi:RecB family exonuclease
MSARKRIRGDATPSLPFGAEPSPPRAAAKTTGSPPERVFLGWDAPALPAAAEWIFAHRGDALDGLLIALPGGRAVRRLTEWMARRAQPGWTPPRLITVGRLVDELLSLERPKASRLARTLAWRRALESLGAPELERLARGATQRRDPESRLRLAETIRTLHGELAPDGLDFEHLERETKGFDHQAERERWRVLARVQAAYRAELVACDLADPHEGRRDALEAGRIDAEARVVLVGVADMNELLAGAIARLGARATALIVAPEVHAPGFDALGRLVPAYWNAIDVPFDDARWHVEEKPADQADRAVDLIAGWAERHAAEAITLGIADDEVVPYLERRLRAAAVAGPDRTASSAANGARLRIAAGIPLARTRPYRLLTAVCDLVERRGWADLAVLARHPDAAPLLSDPTGERDPALVLDTYYADHLPHAVLTRWHGKPGDSRAIGALTGRLGDLLGDLGRRHAAPLASWCAPVRALLARVYGRALDPEVEAERVLAGALRAIGATLEELETVPPALAGDAALPHDALRLVLRALRSSSVPPAPARPGEPTLEALGWLELPLDDAPALVVTGFNEGRVPRSLSGDAFLPDSMRAKLGLPDDAARLARDVYATRALLAQRADCAFITGRRAKSGDPLVPSRIAFQVPRGRPDEILARVRRFLPPDVAPEPAPRDAAEPAAELARVAEPPPVLRMRVTSFRTFLESPYLFYLKHVLELSSCDDRARELDPMRFGSFAHDVLQAFGESEVRESLSADAIEECLVGAADRLAHERFGADLLPAVELQLEQLKYRFRRVAERQAWRRAQGWRILASEWQPEAGVPFVVDGEPMKLTGRIDRIDAHDDGRWAILDYKTGDAGAHPDAAARTKSGWKDLQLPLYRVLAAPFAAEHGLAGMPEVGYFHVGKDDEHIGVALADGWDEAVYADALETARAIVRRVRAGEFFELKDARAWDDDHIFRALIGADLLQAAIAEEDE